MGLVDNPLQKWYNEAMEVTKLVEVAETLSRIQIEGVWDATGFSNADKHTGAHLAAIVKADPTNERNVKALAGIVSHYRRQVEGLTSPEFYEEVKALSVGGAITPEQRREARMVVIGSSGVHPRLGPSVFFDFAYNRGFIDTLKGFGARGLKEGEIWFWAVAPAKVQDAKRALAMQGATFVGTFEIAPEHVERAKEIEQERGVIKAFMAANQVVISFPYDPNLVEAIKALPTRRYFKDEQQRPFWTFPAKHLALAIENLNNAGADVTELEALAENVPHLDQPAPAETIRPVNEDLRASASKFPHQLVALDWLTRPIGEVRKQIVGGASIRGFILGDDMGLGKTIEAMGAADAIAAEDETILVIPPASLKNNWASEIRKFLGVLADVHIVKGRGDVRKARWVIDNYDNIHRDYEDLVEMGFAVLICDEAHRVKNRESRRTKYIVGGRLKIKREPTPDDAATERSVVIDGLCAKATKRVMMLTGTPMDNRPKDLFQLLKATGHPLGRNFPKFGRMYCDPMEHFGKYGRHFGTSYDGASNIKDLRAKINPIFLQRKKGEVGIKLPNLGRRWTAVTCDISAYKAKMDEYAARRAAGELSEPILLSLLTQARACTAVATIKNTIERIEDVLEETEGKVIVFSNFQEPVDKFMEHFGDKAVKITGEQSAAQKTAAEKKFQTDPNVHLLVANLMAGGEGLNLTAASHIITNDLTWKPGAHTQGEARAHRIGSQFENVTTEYMIAAGTFAEDMAILLEEKFQVINTFEQQEQQDLFHKLVERLQNPSTPRNGGVRRLHKALDKR